MTHPEIIAILQTVIDWTWAPIGIIGLLALLVILCGLGSAIADDNPDDY